MKRREFLATSLALPALAQPKPRSFSTRGDQFLLDGQPFLIRSGEMHYPRVPRPYWRDRMRKMRAMGLNTLCTYVFWDLHEPQPGVYDFAGQNDLAAFIKAAQEEGLYVILRLQDYDLWLDSTPGQASTPQLALLALLGPYPAEQMQAREAHPDVGNVRNNHPGLLNSA